MDFNALDEALLEIVQIRNELQAIGYEDLRYDEVEEQLHKLEDSFIENYGDEMEKVLQEVHDKLCPDTDVLLPIAYMAKRYLAVGTQDDGRQNFDVGMHEGVPVILDEYPNHTSRIVLVPNPPRLILQISNSRRFQVWPQAETSED